MSSFVNKKNVEIKNKKCNFLKPVGIKDIIMLIRRKTLEKKMNNSTSNLEKLVNEPYKYGFAVLYFGYPKYDSSLWIYTGVGNADKDTREGYESVW